ncbi:MAG: fibronectin type III domain-containing protein [Vicinamibacterales bacterium]
MANLGVVPLTSTGLTVPNVPPGVYYVRVVASNTAGASAPTAETSIAVGLAAPPGAPRSLAGSSAGAGAVMLSWQAPSSGPAPTGYLLLAGYAPGAGIFQIPVASPGLAAAGCRRAPITSASSP